MGWLEKMSAALNYIEDNIADEIKYDEAAKLACCSMHQFGRVFSYIVGTSLSEYIRRRKLTLVALELQGSDEKIIDIAIKYGYDSPDAFTRAFSNMHGVTPKEARLTGVKLKAYPRITLDISISGDEEIEYRIEDKGEINLVGMVRTIKCKTKDTSADDWKAAAGEVWDVWDEFLNGGTNEKLSRFYNSPMWQMGFTETYANDEMLLAIGAEVDLDELLDMQCYTIPKNRWAVFTARGSLSETEHPIDALWTRITAEWFPEFGYKRAADYEIEVYPPGDAKSEAYTCEIWIPVI